MINSRNYEIIKAFGKRIKELRVSKGLSQEQLANQADVPLSQIGRIERGEINPTLSTISVLSRAFNLSIEQIFKQL